MRHPFQAIFKDGLGRVVSDGQVTVYKAGTSTLATIYGTETGAAISGSVITTGAVGNYSFWVDDGDYFQNQKFDIAHSKSGFITQTYSNISIINGFEYDYYADFNESDQGVAGNGNTLKAYITSIGSNKATICLKRGVYTVITPITIPANIKIVALNGAAITKGGSGTITINGNFEAGNYGVFSGFNSGDVVFGAGSIEQVIPQWFNVLADGSDETSKIQACISSVANIDGNVYFSKGTYGVTNINIANGVNINFYGDGEGSVIKHLVSSNALLSNTGTINSLNIQYLLFDGNQVSQTDWETRMLKLTVDNCLIDNCDFINGVHTAINFTDIITNATICNSRFIGMRESDNIAGHDTTIVLVNGSQATPGEFNFINNYCEVDVPGTVGMAAGGVCVSYDLSAYTAKIRANVINNTFKNVGQKASTAGHYISPIHFYNGVTNGIISGNTIINPLYRAIQAQRCEDIEITENIVADATQTSVSDEPMIYVSHRAGASGPAFNPGRIVVSKNIFKNCPDSLPIWCEFDSGYEGENLSIEGNIADTIMGGIIVTRLKEDCVIANNILRNIDTGTHSASNFKGIYVSNCIDGANIIINGNTVHYKSGAVASANGIRVAPVAGQTDIDVLVANNILNRCNDYCVDIRSCRTTISDNHISSKYDVGDTGAVYVKDCGYVNVHNNHAYSGGLLVDGTGNTIFYETGNTWTPLWSTPSQITANQNDYNPNSYNRWRLSSDASRDITGIASRPVGGVLTIVNTGSNAIVLKHQSASSTAANRIISYSGADITLSAGNTAILNYDTSSSRWRIIS